SLESYCRMYLRRVNANQSAHRIIRWALLIQQKRIGPIAKSGLEAVPKTRNEPGRMEGVW
ncbi:hypothetical protein ABES02_29435, partial [Neobacillus pocheonensis]|uniref:hypothetical protein n=1 Tax=Neobacillus pocheonensis TaxID=363869 RepID=UPI003D2678C7